MLGLSTGTNGVGVTQAMNSLALSGSTDAATATAYSISQQLVTSAWNLLFAVVLVAAIAIGAWYGNRQVWFLGTDDGGRVALYRGLPYELPFGVELYDVRYTSPIQTGALSSRRQDAVTGHDLRSREDAASLVEEIEESQGIGK